MYRLKAVGVALGRWVVVILLAPWLVAFARTLRGRLEGLFGVVIQALLVAGTVWLVTDSTLAGSVALGALALFVPLCGVAVWGMRAAGDGTGQVGSHFLRDEPAPESVGWADIENEYAWLVAVLVTRLPFLIPADEGRAARRTIHELMRATEAHPDYRGLALVTDLQGNRLLRGVLDPQHCYSYRPEPREPGERFGMLVFLHGHGTNMLFVVHALRPLCDRLRLCLVAPTFGYGNWEAPGGSAAIERAARFGYEAWNPDPARVLLMGLSQGGAGVSRAAADRPDRYAGLVFVSATMELPVLGSEAFVNGWKGRNVFVIQGDRDRNVRPESVDAAVQQLEADGVRVTQHRAPAAAHFLFFAQLDTVTDAVCDWARTALGVPRALQV
jgi:pimeloyl-ACP methyl ester carboxylesterase